MKKKAKLHWSDRAKSDLRRLRKKIVALGVPRTARSFITRLRKYANDLRDFPERGAVVEEYNDPSIREIYFRGQRIQYRYDGIWIVIITVFHGSHTPNLQDFLGE